MTITISSDYVPRPWQCNFAQGMKGKNRAFLLWARRHGKDIACWNYMIWQAIQRKGSYYYLYPRQNQARKAIWEGMTSTGKRFLDYIPRELYAKDPNNSEMAIQLINGSIIRILGSDNADALRSGNPVGIVFSEYAWHHAQTWDAVVEPILRENKGWALFNTTPFGRNHAHDLWQYAIKHPEIWYTEKVTNIESNMISDDEFQEMRDRGVSEDVIQGEYFCNWNRGVEGAYYAKIIQTLQLDSRIKAVPKDDYAQVHTAWDLGFGDSTAIFWFQVIRDEVRILDYYENHGEGLPHYIGIIEERGNKNKYKYGSHYFPHDAGAGSLATGGSLAKYAYELGIKAVVLPREAIHLGIERVRKYLPRCFIDEKKCAHAIKCLESYRKTFNETTQCYSDTPLHDNTSHCADSARYMFMAIENHLSGSSYSLEKHQELKKKYASPGLGYNPSNNSILGN
jgi:phage terminase large subunit